MTRTTIELPFHPLFDAGEGEPIILLHGLFGNLSNWGHVAFELTATNRVIVPRLPLFANPVSSERLEDLVDYLKNFIDHHQLDNVVLMGNSLGGHVATVFHDRLPNSQLIFLDHCGHVPMMEQPKLFNRHVREYLDQ
jgi:2-hydroxy-6-oxonona-2,4-dienedioate hydrolase